MATLSSLLLVALVILSLSPSSSAQAQTGPNITTEAITEKPKFSPFKPSMAVIVGVLTAMFSVTFLVLLYARHCKRGAGGADQYQSSYFSSAAGRKNSGVDRAVVESLPVFRFGRTGETGRAECAVCLSRFERSEVLRLLPKCRHAFHVECVDTWLEAHSTCPLCRLRVDPEDILLVHQSPDIETGNDNNRNDNASTAWFRRVSGRHSSAGERAFQLTDTASFRRSLDSWHWKRLRNNNNNRKDGMLLSERQARVRNTRLGPTQRWSDVQPSDLLYLRSEMIMSDAASGSLPTRQQACVGGRGASVMSSRSASEITGASRFGNDSNRVGNDSRRRAGLLSRWKAWVSQRQLLVR